MKWTKSQYEKAEAGRILAYAGWVAVYSDHGRGLLLTSGPGWDQRPHPLHHGMLLVWYASSGDFLTDEVRIRGALETAFEGEEKRGLFLTNWGEAGNLVMKRSEAFQPTPYRALRVLGLWRPSWLPAGVN